MQASSATTMPHAGRVAPPVAPVSLRSRQVVIVLAWGILLWFLAAVFIRYAPPVLFERGAATAFLFATVVPIAWVTIWATRRVASLGPDQLVAGVALGCAAAMFCDGIALTWSALYGSGRNLVTAAAWLLLGVGAILVAAFITARRDGA